MMDPEQDLLPQSSPSISSVSSSDLDTESTGSFFHDRSTTLGTLMGVSFPAITAGVPSQSENHVGVAIVGGGGGGVGGATNRRSKRVIVTAVAAFGRKRRRMRRRWWNWNLCRDDSARPASLADYLEVERRFGDGAFYGEAAELENVVAPPSAAGNGRLLFADGRVLPPTQEEATTPATGTLYRLPVLLTGICSGGGG